MDRTRKITGLSILVLAQVVLFVIVYLITIVVGIGLIYLAFHASVWIIPQFFENVAPYILRLGKAGGLLLVGIIVGIVGLWAFIIAVGIYLIKPLFIFPKRNMNHGKELHREDSPKLYDMIMDTAKAVGVKEPKHIYVNHEVNACVFFNTGFWNIFFPVRKNLIIGLGLFESTNSEEVKSIIAHEFGHFAQSSMRVGSVLYIANKVIADLVYRRDKLDYLMLRWCLQDGIWGFWGKATKSVVIKFRSLVDYMFRSQQRNYMKLSRQMEYDADAAACRVVGTEIFISALCKVQQLNKSFNFYNQMLGYLANQHQTVSDYWKGYEMIQPNMSVLKIKIPLYDRLETTPELEKVKSRVSVEEIWSSHPEVEKRIGHAKALGIISPNSQAITPAWDMIEATLKAEVSATLLKQLKDNNPSITAIDWNTYKDTLAKRIKVSFLPEEVEVFFDRNIITEAECESVENPLSDDNRMVIMEYEQALSDKGVLALLNDKKIDVKHFVYNGTDYSIKNVPVSEHDQYVAELRKKVEKIDGAIKNYAKSKAKDKELITAAYEAISYAQTVIASIREDFIPVKEDMIRELNESKVAGGEDLKALCSWLDSYERELTVELKKLKYGQLLPFMSQEEYAHIINFLDEGSSFITAFDGAAVTRMFAITDWIVRIHDNLAHSSKIVIANVILDRELSDVGFLELWYQPEHEVCKDETTTPADGRERIVIDSSYGPLNLIVPTDEEIEHIYYEEWFRWRILSKYESLEIGQEMDYSLVGTVPFKREENGKVSCVNPEDEKKFYAEMRELYNFFRKHVRPKDWDKISEAADQGEGYANSLMAERYMSQQRYNMAFDFAMKGAFAGDMYGIVILGMLKGYAQDHNPELAFKLFKCAAAIGDDDALYRLGLSYANGEGTKQDDKKAFRLFERAAVQGNVLAQNKVGYMYFNGVGTEIDASKGFYWSRKAILNGCVEAINNIWPYHKSIGDMDTYIQVVQWGASKGLEECLAELNTINALGTQFVSNASNYDPVVNNPKPVYDTSVEQGLCPVCGKPISPQTTICPHCKEIIWEE